MKFRDRHLPLLVLAVGAAAGLPAWAGHPAGPDELPSHAGELGAASVTAAARTETLTPVDPPDLIPPVAAPPPRRPSTSVTVNLIHRMVEHKLLSQEEADALIKDAEADAEVARSDADAARASAEQAAVSAQAAKAWLTQAGAVPEPLPPEEESMRITYIPEAVKEQMREEIKRDVLAEARDQHWAAPNLLPEWTTRIKLFGDIRVRYEGLNFPSGNDNSGAFPNFNAVNTGAPFDVAGTVFSPQLDVDKNRNRFRIRVRLGVDADLGYGFSAGVRLGTGENDSPVTESQTLGVANQGQGGNFSKYSIWLDRGFLKYELGGTAQKNLAATVGRFDNPFFSTTNIWSNDIGFDGAVLHGHYQIGKGFIPFFTMGAFPVFNTDINFASNSPTKFKSTDKYLYGGQTGFDLKIKKDFAFKAAVAYYNFQGVQGRLSDPFVPLTASDQGNTDDTRPAFAQNGNTYRPLRNIIPTAANNFGTTNQFQYFGLASSFKELSLNGRLDYNRWEPYQVSLIGEYEKNVAFNGGELDKIAVNNRGPDNALGQTGHFVGGDTAWFVGVTFGKAKLDHFGAWNVGANYRYVESDSVIDGFNDADFGAPLTGTNLKGYSLFGNVALSPRISLGVRWMSADSIAGPTYKSDVIQAEVNGNF